METAAPAGAGGGAGPGRAQRSPAGQRAVGQRRDGDGEHGDGDHAADARSRSGRAAGYARRPARPAWAAPRHQRRSIALVADEHDGMVVPRRVGDGERDDLGVAQPGRHGQRRPAADENGRGRAATRSSGGAAVRSSGIGQLPMAPVAGDPPAEAAVVAADQPGAGGGLGVDQPVGVDENADVQRPDSRSRSGSAGRDHISTTSKARGGPSTGAQAPEARAASTQRPTPTLSASPS